MRILPDTSAWIAYSRSVDTPASIKLRRLIELEEDICLCGGRWLPKFCRD